VDISTAHRGFNQNITITGSGGATSSVIGMLSSIINSNTGTVVAVVGLNGIARTNATSGNVTVANGVLGRIGTIDAGTISTGNAFYADLPSKTSTGNIAIIVGFHAANQGLSGTTSSYGLLIDAQSGSTNNYAIYTNAGKIYLGDWIDHTITSSTTTYAISSNFVFTGTGSIITGEVFTSVARDTAGVTTMRGLYAVTGVQSITSSTTVSAAKALGCQLSFNAATLLTTTVSTWAMALEVNAPSMNGVGTISIRDLAGIYIANPGHANITNSYGLYIASVSGAVTNNYAIYTNAGRVYFGDRTQTNISFTNEALAIIGYNVQVSKTSAAADATNTVGINISVNTQGTNTYSGATGLSAYVYNYSSGQNSQIISGTFYYGVHGAGGVTQAYCLNLSQYSTGAGTIGTAYGINIAALSTASLTTTTSYAINIAADTRASGTSRYGLYIGDRKSTRLNSSHIRYPL
jgi:hypothetical protein